MSKRLTEELKDAIVADYLSGVTNKEIIEKYKTYELYSILNERGIQHKTNIEERNKKYEKVIELYLNGESISSINRITGCTDVYSILARFGIEKNRRLSTEIKDAIVMDYLSGVTTREIAKKYKTHQLYRILDERGIEYKQDNNKQKERQNLVVELYLSDVSIDEIIEKTGYKDVYKIIKKFGIKRNIDPKKYNTNKKDERNKNLIEDYFSGEYAIECLAEKYNMSTTNIYRIFRVYDIKTVRNDRHHWVIRQKVKSEPNVKCKFYILENYFGYTKIGITTQNSVRKRFKKDINVYYEIENNLQYCYDLESNLKKILKFHTPENIDKTIDGWSECYSLSPEKVLEYVKSTVQVPVPVAA